MTRQQRIALENHCRLAGETLHARFVTVGMVDVRGTSEARRRLRFLSASPRLLQVVKPALVEAGEI